MGPTMLQHLKDFPAYYLLFLPSVILQTWIFRFGIELYREKPAMDARMRVLGSLLVADIVLFGCMWHLRPYGAPVEFPAAGSTLRYEAANHLTEEPAVVYISADDTRTAEKHSYAITFQDVHTGELVLQTYLKSGQGAKILVPPGEFAISVQQGQRWFGPKTLFGPQGEDLPSPGIVNVRPGGLSELQIREAAPRE